MGKKTNSFSLFIGIEGGGDVNTNEIIYRLLNIMNLSTEFEGKKYKDEIVNVWKVTPAFVKTLYASKDDLKIKIVVYRELDDATLQHFRLIEPGIKKRAKQRQTTFKFFKKIKKKL